MKKFIIKFIILFVIVLTPIISFPIICNAMQGDKYGESYYAELKYKTERLDNTKENKIIFIGGSSLAFGLRSDKLEEALGYKVINYGLYASLGTKVMMDLAYPSINSGDVVIIGPEINNETYSTNINYGVLNKCLENCKTLIRRLSPDDQVKTLINKYPYYIEKIATNPNPVAPYDLASFNEYGDIESDVVKNNILYSYYDDSQLVMPNKKLLNNDFIDMLNSYANNVKKKNAKIYFSYSPTNKLSLVDNDLNEFETTLKNKLNFDILGSVLNYTYHQDYFYDTNYHLNYTGSVLHTKNLATDINQKLGLKKEINIEVPAKPAPKYEISEDVDSSTIFNVRKYGQSYVITGVKDDYKNLEKVVVPSSIDGYVVDGIFGGAFANMPNLEVVILPDTIDQINNDIFLNSPNVTRLYIQNKVAPSIVGNGILNGASPDIKIYIPKAAMASYSIGYTWLSYKKYLVTYQKEEI